MIPLSCMTEVCSPSNRGLERDEKALSSSRKSQRSRRALCFSVILSSLGSGFLRRLFPFFWLFAFSGACSFLSGLCLSLFMAKARSRLSLWSSAVSLINPVSSSLTSSSYESKSPTTPQVICPDGQSLKRELFPFFWIGSLLYRQSTDRRKERGR